MKKPRNWLTFTTGKCIYFPYLGKNDHPADITNVEKVVVEETILKETVISSMFLKETGSLIMPDDEDDIEVFKYAEKLPVALDGYTNLYEYADICYTNMLVDINDDKLYKLYKTEGKVLSFTNNYINDVTSGNGNLL